MNDLMIVDSFEGAVRPQTDAPKGSKLIIYNDDEATGFSGTVFKDTSTGEYVIAFRGTEIGNEKNKCLNSRI